MPRGRGVEDTNWDQLVRGQRARLVEQDAVHLAGHRQAEGLGAEDAGLEEGHERRVDGHGGLHRQVARNDRGEDDDATQEQLVRGAVALLEALLEDEGRRDQREDEEQHQRRDGLARVVRDGLLRKFDHLHQLALRAGEASPQDEAETAAVRRGRHASVGRVGARRARLRRGDDRRAREEGVHAVGAVEVERTAGGSCVAQPEREPVLHLWDRLASERGLVDDCSATQQQAVARHNVVDGLGGRRAGPRGGSGRGAGGEWRRAGGLARREEGDQVAREKVSGGELLPRAAAEDVHPKGLGRHRVERLERALPLHHRGGFEKEDREDLKEGEAVRDGVEQPQHRAEDLEDDERREQLLDVQVDEARCLDGEHIGPKLLGAQRDGVVRRQAARRGVGADMQRAR
mmetsp:Transcript_32457/g.103528  ORF Transcript_32457/g.103528 Transcript_32457/m.103528 type:complete len:402 (+) Transcript_32457:4677-5882(+)